VKLSSYKVLTVCLLITKRGHANNHILLSAADSSQVQRVTLPRLKLDLLAASKALINQSVSGLIDSKEADATS